MPAKIVPSILNRLYNQYNISITAYPFFYKGNIIKYAACIVYDNDVYVLSKTDDVTVIEKYHRVSMNGQTLHYSHIDSIEEAISYGVEFALYLEENNFNIDLIKLNS